MGFKSPGYTQVPNELFDLMPNMSNQELRIVLAVIRNTFGWRRDSHAMSLSYLEKATGLSRQGVINGAEQAEEHGHISRKRPHPKASWEYSLVVNDVDQGGGQVVNDVDQQVVNDVDTTKKVVKENNAAAKPLTERQLVINELVRIMEGAEYGNPEHEKLLSAVPYPKYAKWASQVVSMGASAMDIKVWYGTVWAKDWRYGQQRPTWDVVRKGLVSMKAGATEPDRVVVSTVEI